MTRRARDLAERLRAPGVATCTAIAIVALLSSGAGSARSGDGAVAGEFRTIAAVATDDRVAAARAAVRDLHARRKAHERGRASVRKAARADSRPAASDPSPPAPRRTVVYALGDGADGSASARALADYVEARDPDRFFYLGDVYESGTAPEFAEKYEPLYGSLAAKTDPVIGNHESGNRERGYYPYWADKRGWTPERAKHRAYVDAASGWQIVAYSSEEPDMASEARWVGRRLAEHRGTCRIVIAHRGRHVVADTGHDDNVDQEPVWSRIAHRAAINLVGHNHLYGRLEPVDGVTVIVSGAGRRSDRSLGPQHHVVADSATGVATATRLVLRRGAAEFSQVDADGTVYDSGTIACTPAP
jgi:hypothetical protein